MTAATLTPAACVFDWCVFGAGDLHPDHESAIVTVPTVNGQTVKVMLDVAAGSQRPLLYLSAPEDGLDAAAIDALIDVLAHHAAMMRASARQVQP
ncbi:hypothetical protein Ade02nite_20210 [Paractinoplanes deccanensis]|uniref:Uncharacterized protein n=1 Tax=Paractinoplanes deccanensis TaxID=113561 RepID=A0ABQ3Y0J7_9ACTN|nr:hypothetical protein [Actinoplanes deccanensis]GID73380.1 hypothetical protein Ade02nite_20210 [Actinoplanes deccanensis]